MNQADPILSGRMMFYGDSSFHASVLRVVLKEAPDLQLLQQAVDEAVKRCPWATYGVREEGGYFYYSDHLSSTLRVAEWSDENPPRLGGPQAEGHLLGVFHQGKSLMFSFFHGLTDGGGIFSFFNQTLSCYGALVADEPLPPCEPAYEDAEAEPLRAVDQAMSRAGIPWDPQLLAGAQQQSEFAVQSKMLLEGARPRTYCVRADAAEAMAFAKRLGIKASAALVTLYAAAFLDVHSLSQGMLKVALPVDFRSVLGVPHTFRNCAVPPVMFDVQVEGGMGIEELAAQINQTILQRLAAPSELYAIKGYAAYMDRIPPMPYAQTEQVLAQYMASDQAPFTFNCSYAYRFQQESYLPLIDGVYGQTSAYGPATILETVALPDSFCIALSQAGSSDVYVRAFIDQLRKNGIRAEIEQVVEGAGPYVELRESLGLR